MPVCTFVPTIIQYLVLSCFPGMLQKVSNSFEFNIFTAVTCTKLSHICYRLSDISAVLSYMEILASTSDPPTALFSFICYRRIHIAMTKPSPI